MQRSVFGAILFVSMMGTATANAAVNLVEKNDWKLDMYGFTELDMTQDSTRSYTEVLGNGAVARPGTSNGDNGRVQDSIRNSRLGFIINAPEQAGWKTKGVLEYDLLGYDPYGNVSAPTNSESGFSQNPTLRVRHGFFNTEKDGLQLYAGQTWSIFGWQPFYQPAVLSVAPEAGEMYQRTAQFGGIKTYGFGESNKLQVGLSVERASQRDSNMPNINVGLRYAYDGFQTATASSYGDYKLNSLSVGVSGTFRQFETAGAGSTTVQNKQNASAVAVDTLIPIIPSSDPKNPGNSLSLTAEYTAGTGYTDELSGWTGGMTGATAQSGATTAWAGTNIDAGFGAFDTNGNFDLLQMQTFNATLQYVLPFETKQMINVGISQVSSNLNTLSLSAGGIGAAGNGISAMSGVYDKIANQFINYWVDVSEQIRLGAEYSNQTTHYVADGVSTVNNRLQVTGVYRF